MDIKRKKPFTLMHCYVEFSKYPKWQTRELETSVKKQKKTIDASPGTATNDLADASSVRTDATSASTDALEHEKRPDGVKKEKLRRGKADDSACKLSLETVWAQKQEKDELKEAARNVRYAQQFELRKEEIALKKKEDARNERDDERKQFELDERIMLMDTSGDHAIPRAASTFPAASHQPPAFPVRESLPFRPQAPWYLSEERHRLLHTSALVSDPDRDLPLSPPGSTPPRSPVAASSAGEEVPDSAPCSAKASSPSIDTSAGLGGPHAFFTSASLAAINGPTLRSIIVSSSTYPSTAGLHGTSPPRAAPLLLDETGWVTVPDRRHPRRDGHSSAPSPTTRSSQAAAAALRFKRRTEGLCARCLAPAHHHLSSNCRDKIRCLSCNLSGHKERHCPHRQALRDAKKQRPRPLPRPPSSSPSAPGARSWAAIVAAPAPVQAPPLQPLLPPPPPMAMTGIGAAATRPKEDTVVIATSFELDKDMKDWEETAAIAWVINGNRKVQALAIDRAVRKKFRLSHNEVAVCPHQPVQFLLKFVCKAHCSEVLKHGRIKADGALLQFRPWRPLEHAFGTSMSYRVRLCLEGVPAYGYTLYVAERIIARRCSFDRLADSSALLTTARSLDCWAWTANPSAIPKVVWLTFTSRGSGALASEVFVHEVRPTGNKRGATFRVLVHLDQMEDYSMAPLNFFGSSNDASAFKPTPVSFDWHYLTVDGMPPVPLQNEDDEEVLRAAALARRARRGNTSDHPRYYHNRRGDRDDDQDGTTLRGVTPAPMARTMPLLARCIVSAATLRVELQAYVDDLARPVLADSAALPDWNARVVAILEKLEASQHLPVTTAFPTPSSATHPASPSLGKCTLTVAVSLGPVDGPADQGHPDDAFDGTVARLELLQLGVGNEAWNDSSATPDEEVLPRSPAPTQTPLAPAEEVQACSPVATQVRPHAPASLATLCCNDNASTDLVGFIGDFAVPIQPPLAATPPSKKKKKPATALPSPRRSGRLAIKRKTRLASDGSVAVQELIARVIGILAPSASFDAVSWEAYQQVFQHAPLASSAIKALEALVKHVKKLKKKGSIDVAPEPDAEAPATVSSVPDV
ncbi:hypothetical protein ACQ4PT_062333 [Festuca glaucescens]